MNRILVGVEVIGRNECVIEVAKLEGILVNQKYGREYMRKNLCWPNGNSDFQEGISEFVKTDCEKKKGMLSSDRWDPFIQHNITPQKTTVLSIIAVRTQISFWLFQ